MNKELLEKHKKYIDNVKSKTIDEQLDKIRYVIGREVTSLEFTDTLLKMIDNLQENIIYCMLKKDENNLLLIHKLREVKENVDTLEKEILYLTHNT